MSSEQPKEHQQFVVTFEDICIGCDMCNDHGNDECSILDGVRSSTPPAPALPTTVNAANWTHEETMNRLQCAYDKGYSEALAKYPECQNCRKIYFLEQNATSLMNLLKKSQEETAEVARKAREECSKEFTWMKPICFGNHEAICDTRCAWVLRKRCIESLRPAQQISHPHPGNIREPFQEP